ncbi:MAG: 2-C-methyl-D-erythritol 4-phosphate cytidylyltransferase [Candidatus Aminicenantes bacterium]|nr:2-C-methyl-D-erythritol 4-phosphate cytidylyltransferase [Candidatus Aminicenantes bacterium]
MKITAVILGGGRGLRTGFTQPKQFLKLGGRPLFDYSVEKFQSAGVESIVAVLVEDYASYYQPHPAITHIAPAGPTRQQSVFNGLKVCPADTDIVIIHDSARPFFPPTAVNKAIKLLAQGKYEGLALAIPATDTLVETKGGEVVRFPERSAFFHTQTPQLFLFKKIWAASQLFSEQNFTDDLSLAFAAGLKCGLVEGNRLNFKITSEVDWLLAEKILNSSGLKFI